VDGRDLHGVLVIKVGQDARHPFGEHRLSRAGRPDHHQVMRAGGSDLQGEPGLGLACNIRQVTVLPDIRLSRIRLLRLGLISTRRLHRGRIGSVGQEHFGEGTVTPYLRARDECGLRTVAKGHDDIAVSGGYGRHDRRKDAADRAEPTVEAELGKKHGPSAAPNVPGGGQRRHHDGKVET
jgi:hypothetical protein